MLGNQPFGFSRSINANAGFSVGFLNLLCLLRALMPFLPAGCCQRRYCQPESNGYQHCHRVIYLLYAEVRRNNAPESPQDECTQEEARYCPQNGKVAEHSKPPYNTKIIGLRLAGILGILCFHFTKHVFVDFYNSGGQRHCQYQSPEAGDVSSHDKQE